ncbi:MAG: class II aldolase/adducin family protein [Bryobacterales bacterium]|nr:class II aldolase/adducin family protein [Bryobacterales bacterium]
MLELERLCEVCSSFFARGYAFGSTGNISIRIGDEVWITPTGGSLRKLAPTAIACIDMQGGARNEAKASKEYPFHLAAYQSAGAKANAIVHLHSTYAVALSCLDGLDEHQPLPVVTPYYLMRVAPVAVVPYFRPGSTELAGAIGEAARGHNTILLRNHGLVCLGSSLEEAVDRTEEFEETAKLYFLLRGEKLRCLTADQQAEIGRVFGRK